jgi:hypothetical protein
MTNPVTPDLHVPAHALAARVLAHLCAHWAPDPAGLRGEVDLYSVNVPMVPALHDGAPLPVRHTSVWRNGARDRRAPEQPALTPRTRVRPPFRRARRARSARARGRRETRRARRTGRVARRARGPGPGPAGRRAPGPGRARRARVQVGAGHAWRVEPDRGRARAGPLGLAGTRGWLRERERAPRVLCAAGAR